MLSGSTSDSSPTVIFVHGLRTSAALWDEQVRALRAEGIASRAVDLPGHGTRRGQTFTMAGALDVIDQTVAELGTSHYVLVGLSLGGYTALHYAARERRRADSGQSSGLLGVLAAACSSDPSTKPVRAYRDVAAWVAAHGPKLRRALPHKKVETTASAAGEERLPWTVVTDALTVLDKVSSKADLAQISVPVLLVNGRWDHLRLEERAHRAAAVRARLITIPGSKHDVSLEAPAEFNHHLLKFIASLPVPEFATG